MMTDQRHCPTCGARLAAKAPLGQCARCLLKLAMVAEEPDAAGGAPIPKQFGDYELLGEIARGGMGVVYKARQKSLDRIVALKIILSGALASEAERKRFRSEAESSAELDHPNIVPIYEVGDQDGQPFLTMKFIDGESLAIRLRDLAVPNQRVPPSTAAQLQPEEGDFAVPAKSSVRERQMRVATLMSKIARAVHFAHQRAIIHRDLKPANILLDSRGEPHITDFGLAKRLTAEAHVSTVDPQLTLTGSILGSPSYIAPEQASGLTKRLSTAADIYSLGVILYQLLTRELPFPGDSAMDILRQVIECEPERPRVHNPAIDRDLETICLKCLDKDPQRRYGSAEALVDDLDRWSRREPIAAIPATAWTRTIKWIRRKPLHASLLAVIVVAIAGPFVVADFYRKRLPHMATEHPVVTFNRAFSHCRFMEGLRKIVAPIISGAALSTAPTALFGSRLRTSPLTCSR